MLAVTFVASMRPPALTMIPWAYWPVALTVVPFTAIAVPDPVAKMPLAPFPVVVTLPPFIVIVDVLLARTPASRP